jgi:hypothetical protein
VARISAAGDGLLSPLLQARTYLRPSIQKEITLRAFEYEHRRRIERRSAAGQHVIEYDEGVYGVSATASRKFL